MSQSKPEWVRIIGSHGEPYYPKVLRVLRWNGENPVVESPCDQNGWELYCAWEPCDPPASQSPQNVAQAEARAGEERVKALEREVESQDGLIRKLSLDFAAAVARAEKAEQGLEREKRNADNAYRECVEALTRAKAAEAEVARLKAQLAPATSDPRREVGAVVEFGGLEFAVIFSGDGERKQRGLTRGSAVAPWGYTSSEDKFVRWMTPEECARHGIAYVQRDKGGSPVNVTLVGGEPDNDAMILGLIRQMDSDREPYPSWGTFTSLVACYRILAAALKAKGGSRG